MSKKHLQLLLRWEAYNRPHGTCKNQMQGLFNEKIMSVATMTRHTYIGGEMGLETAW